MRNTTIALLIMMALTLSGCAPSSLQPNEGDRGLPAGVSRFVDEEAGVVCWRYFAMSTGVGISCLPVSDTNLN